MQREVFFHDLKNPDSALSADLENVELGLSLRTLYLIYMTSDDKEVTWGARVKDQHSSSPEIVIKRLLDFMERYGVHGATSHEQAKVLYEPKSEVEYVLGRYMIPYVRGHGGSVELLEIKEESGEVKLLLKGVCGHCATPVIEHMESGMKHVLKRLLPWVKEVLIEEEQPV